VSASRLVLLSPLAVDIITSSRYVTMYVFSSRRRRKPTLLCRRRPQHSIHCSSCATGVLLDSRGIVFQMYYSVPNRESGP